MDVWMLWRGLQIHFCLESYCPSVTLPGEQAEDYKNFFFLKGGGGFDFFCFPPPPPFFGGGWGMGVYLKKNNQQLLRY